MKTIPNCISLFRIFSSLCLFFVEPLSISFYIIYIACGLSDIADGFIARKTGTSSNFGAKLDTISDMIMVGVLFIVLYPVVNLKSYIILWIISIGIVRVVSIVVALIKYKAFAMLHSYGNKLTGLSLFIFPILLPFINITTLMYIICFVASLSAIEELAIHTTSRELNVNKQSIFIK